MRRLIESWIAAADQAGSLLELLTVLDLSRHSPIGSARTIERWLDAPEAIQGARYAPVRAAFIAAARALLEYDAGERQRAIGIPTLLTVGDEDEVLPPVHTRALAAVIPNAVVAVFAGCGHQPFQEQPDRFNKLAADFLSAANIREQTVSA